MKLRHIKKAPFEIAKQLAQDNKVVNLIFNDNKTALVDSDVVVSISELIEKNYIGFYPATESGINLIDRNTFIIINMEDINLQADDNNIRATGAIYVTTDKDHCLLENNSLRLLELVDAIESCLEGEKISAAGKIQLSSVNYVVFSDFRSGYRINFRINDQQSRRAEL